MHNVLVASSLNISLPLDPPTKTLSKFEAKETSSAALGLYNYIDFDTISLDQMGGVGGPTPEAPEYSVGNTSVSTGNTSLPKKPDSVPHYPNGVVKLLAQNYSAISMLQPSIVSQGQSRANRCSPDMQGILCAA
jgi:hypothetical protein